MPREDQIDHSKHSLKRKHCVWLGIFCSHERSDLRTKGVLIRPLIAFSELLNLFDIGPASTRGKERGKLSGSARETFWSAEQRGLL